MPLALANNLLKSEIRLQGCKDARIQGYKNGEDARRQGRTIARTYGCKFARTHARTHARMQEHKDGKDGKDARMRG